VENDTFLRLVAAIHLVVDLFLLAVLAVLWHLVRKWPHEPEARAELSDSHPGRERAAATPRMPLRQAGALLQDLPGSLPQLAQRHHRPAYRADAPTPHRPPRAY